MKHKYTSGPWRVKSNGTVFLDYTVVAGDVEICGVMGSVEFDNEKANAELIAAAPELLEALKELADCHTWSNGHTPADLAQTVGKAYQAIKKAEEK